MGCLVSVRETTIIAGLPMVRSVVGRIQWSQSASIRDQLAILVAHLRIHAAISIRRLLTLRVLRHLIRTVVVGHIVRRGLRRLVLRELKVLRLLLVAVQRPRILRLTIIGDGAPSVK